MSVNLFVQAMTKFLTGVLLTGLLIYLPAGTLLFFQGTLLMVILFIPMFFAGVIMMIKNPALLEKRLKGKEEQKVQDRIVRWCGLMFAAEFLAAGLGYRLGWYIFPVWLTCIAAVVFLIAYILYAEVLRENRYLSRIIEVEEGQRVIDTGLYGIVRHPMYSATLLLFLSIPVILGSLYAFIIFLVYPFLLVKRIKNEEEVLKKELAGYLQYQQKVRYRLIPFLW